MIKMLFHSSEKMPCIITFTTYQRFQTMKQWKKKYIYICMYVYIYIWMYIYVYIYNIRTYIHTMYKQRFIVTQSLIGKIQFKINNN